MTVWAAVLVAAALFIGPAHASSTCWQADLNANGVVNFEDLAYVKERFFTSDPIADIDGDGIVSFSDLAIVKEHFFMSCARPLADWRCDAAGENCHLSFRISCAPKDESCAERFMDCHGLPVTTGFNIPGVRHASFDPPLAAPSCAQMGITNAELRAADVVSVFGRLHAVLPGHTYSTEFPRAELPLTEGGAWSHLAGAWLRVQATGGRAQGEGVNLGYNDAYALLSGFPADQRVHAVIHKQATAPGCQPEVELLLRVTDTATTVRGYEVNLNHGGLVQIVRWDGCMGCFQEVGGGSKTFVDGAEFEAEVIGTQIRAYVDGTLVAQATADISSGQPGLGFFHRECATSADLTFESFTAEGL